MLYIYCNKPSKSAQALRNQIRRIGYRVKRLRFPGVPPKPGTIINWGCQACQSGPKHSILNTPGSVRRAVSKLESVKYFEDKDVPHVRITLSKKQADEWLKKGSDVLVRKDGLQEGRGIKVYDGQNLKPGQFYSRVFPKTHEFRVHVVRGCAVDFTQKKLSESAPKLNPLHRLVRSHGNGWVFAHNDLVCTHEDKVSLEQIAVRGCEALGLDFGAVDLLAIFDKNSPRRLRKAVICEINTRPGLENERTIEAYADAFLHPGSAVLRKGAEHEPPGNPGLLGMVPGARRDVYPDGFPSRRA